MHWQWMFPTSSLNVPTLQVWAQSYGAQMLAGSGRWYGRPTSALWSRAFSLLGDWNWQCTWFLRVRWGGHELEHLIWILYCIGTLYDQWLVLWNILIANVAFAEETSYTFLNHNLALERTRTDSMYPHYPSIPATYPIIVHQDPLIYHLSLRWLYLHFTSTRAITRLNQAAALWTNLKSFSSAEYRLMRPGHRPSWNVGWKDVRALSSGGGIKECRGDSAAGEKTANAKWGRECCAWLLSAYNQSHLKKVKPSTQLVLSTLII